MPLCIIKPLNDVRRKFSTIPTGNQEGRSLQPDFTDMICPYMGQGEYPLTLFIDPQPYKRIGCAKHGQKHLHAKVSNAEAEVT